MNTTVLYFVSLIVHLLPDTRCWKLKRVLYRLCGMQIGKGVKICSNVIFTGNASISIGDYVWIGHETLIVASAPVTIGNNVNIAPRVYIGTGTHEINPDGLSVAGKGKSLPIKIGSGAWLCANSQILAGVSVGDCSIVAMGGVVLKDVPSHEVWGGVPVRKLKSLR